MNAATATRMIHRLADGALVQIPNGGHDLGVEQPEVVAAAVRAFLSRR
jgi:pimeloyl-ACP methyl ester carboxylesterase